MRKFLTNIWKYREAILHVFFWIFYFMMVNIDWTHNWLDKTVRPQSPAPILGILFPCLFYWNAFFLVPRYLKKRRWVGYFTVALGTLLALELTRVGVTLWVMGSDYSFPESVYYEAISRDGIFNGGPNVLVLAFIFSFAYRFTRDWLVNNRVIERLEKEKLQMELNLLKAHTDPHFLFNNLNTLDDLIDRDTTRAKRYLHELSALYRYIISSTKEDVVRLDQEWAFMQNYIYLVHERYGGAYQFDIPEKWTGMTHYFIPPAAIQGLIENVVKHNQASLEYPLNIVIQIDGNGVRIAHEKRLKRSTGQTLGTGLNNLKARYKLLTSDTIEIEDSDQFVVILPLIKAL